MRFNLITKAALLLALHAGNAVSHSWVRGSAEDIICVCA